MLDAVTFRKDCVLKSEFSTYPGTLSILLSGETDFALNRLRRLLSSVVICHECLEFKTLLLQYSNKWEHVLKSSKRSVTVDSCLIVLLLLALPRANIQGEPDVTTICWASIP